MSTRNIRKLREKLQASAVQSNNENEVDEGGNFEPFGLATKIASAYEGLELSSSSSNDEEDYNITKQSAKESSDEEAVAIVLKNRKKKRNNGKKRNRNKRNFDDEEDEDIDRAVAEVNELLGEPPESAIDQMTTLDISLGLMKIDYKYLNLHNEVFGPKDEKTRGKRKRHNYRLLRRQIIMTNDHYDFSVRGLSMSLIEVKDGIKYFKFEHGPEYQKHMHALLKAMKMHYDNYIRDQDNEIYATNTVEALITNLDLYFQYDESGLGVASLEDAIFFMQGVFDPAFNYLDGKTRLEYKFVENRIFHIALLKYLHILTNKACHRTALELAKLMLNLDPSDPLGVIFIVDTLALRAREHQWLVNIYDHWANEKDATRLFHLSYSHALAMYHLYLKNKDDDTLREANSLIKYALVKYPNVSLMLMKLTNNENSELMNHEMFTTLVNKTTSPDLMNLQLLYAKFVWPKWREQNIMEWVICNALEIISRLKNDLTTEENVRVAGVERARLFRKYPLEIKRHLSSISSMSNLLVDGAVPTVAKTLPFNPYPSEGRCVDVYRYYKHWGVKYDEKDQVEVGEETRRGVLHSFIASLVPDAENPE